TGKKFSAETRTLSVPQNERAETQIIEALLSGPSSETLQPVAENFSLEKVELLPDVINVFLNLEEGIYKSEEQIITAKLAIASTLFDFSGVAYVNIFVNGSQTAYQNLPSGTLQKSKSTLSEDLEKYKRDASAQTAVINATLYFLDISEQFLLPEVRSINFESTQKESMIASVVQEVLAGPEDTYNHAPVVDKLVKDAQLNSVTILQDERGRNVAKLDFNKMPFAQTKAYQDGEQITAAALTTAITGFIPDIDGVQITVNSTEEGLQAGVTVYTANDFSSLLGNSIVLYLPNNTYTLLSSVTRMVEQKNAGYPEELLRELMKGPSAQDSSEIQPAFISGISMDDVNSVYLAGNIAVVDFKGSIREKAAGLSEKNEFIMIYSIVNTLTNISNVRLVQFLVDGERVEYLGDGNQLCVIDPLVKNPGIIRLT
ncbi:MAG: GerMN domain-containing protein, partial [Christensenella sp.]|uniref:GerMN domain-containing protein n=1 Tax=Christensenella sp. TaxID=1935934 RepID=UPI002B21D33A